MNFFDKYELNNCPCGKDHSFSSDIIIGDGVINQLPDALKAKGIKKVFMLSDNNTFSAAGEAVEKILTDSGIKVVGYSFQKDVLEPDETNVGLAIMHFDPSVDAVVGVGSGVVNDISKIVSNISNKFYCIVGTAPSMDGYASATSSMTRDGLKISLPSKCADLIVGDIDILCNAPIKMMVSGLGDMVAKYISIAEWRISNLINGEYYCEKIASLVRTALKKCVDNAKGLLKRDKTAVRAVFEGLVICGAAMNFAGISRPASGCEHYISHIWDMRGAEFGLPVEFHGLQCAVGTLICAKTYEKIKSVVPDIDKAKSYVAAFDREGWSRQLRKFLGKGAEDMIALEVKEQKYSPTLHASRIKRIFDNWEGILKIINEEIPSVKYIEFLLDSIGCPKTPEDIGIDPAILPMTFKASKDIRDKYVLSRLCWDLGIIDEISQSL